MARALALTAGVLAAILGGCSPFGSGTFFCDSNNACNAGTDGRCENGFCSYADSNCASGHRYSDHSGDKSNICVGDKGGDGGIDTPGGPACFGSTNGLVKPCFSSEPTGDVTLPATVNTDSSSLCAATTSGGDGYCVIAAATITVGEGTVAATGSKPLVLVAVNTITVAGTLDAASHHSGMPPQLTDPYTNAQIGAGAAPGSACSAGTAPGTGMGTGAGGGGAGATFGGKGGNGGAGDNGPGGAGNNGGPGGTADAPQAITTFRGGCASQNGSKGTFGEGGDGGGAVYLIARTAINITGAINASGEGGHPGVSGSSGGGGGGSGGMIGLDAPMITNTGAVFANGGSGGEGSGQTTRGSAGPEPTSAAPSPDSGNTSNGGTGGGGGAGGTIPGGPAGRNGTNGAGGVGGGGGGGGGTGVLKVFGATAITGAGDHSPNPS